MTIIEDDTHPVSIRPVIHPLNLQETSNEEGEPKSKKSKQFRKKQKAGKQAKKGTPKSDSDSPFSLEAPRTFAEESRNPIIRRFSQVRDVYEHEVYDSSDEAKPRDELNWNELEYWQYKRKKLVKQVKFVRKLLSRDLKLRFERAIARDLGNALPEVGPADSVDKLSHGAVWARRVVSLENGTLVASANVDYTVTIYDLAANNQKICTLENFSSQVLSLAWLGDDLLATGTEEGDINTWSVRTGELHTTISTELPGITAMVAMDTSKFIAGTSDGSLLLFRHKKGREVWEEKRKEQVHTGKIWRIASYRHEIVSVSEDHTCVLSIARSLKRVGRWRHRDAVTACAIGRNYIVTGSYDTLRIRRRGDDLRRVSIWRNIHGGGWVHSVVLWDNDRLLSTGGDGRMVVYDLSTGIATHRVYTPLCAIWDATLLPHQRVAVCGPWHSANYVVNMESYFTEERASHPSIWSPKSWALPNSARSIGRGSYSIFSPKGIFSPNSSPGSENRSGDARRPFE